MLRSTLTLLLVCTSLLSISQSIKGKITDALNRPIPGAHIVNSRVHIHAHSDITGYFKLDSVELNDTIEVSQLGFQPVTFIVDGFNSDFNIELIETPINLEEAVISPSIDALNLISSINVKTIPVNSSQEILRQVPGLFIGQHAGGGKAEQMFLRGFDIDHGTDISLTADGIPVNMVSHAHGQGYADLHFIIPETIERIEFGKGPYYGNQGNFNTAGYVDFRTQEALANSTIKLEAGDFGTFRTLGMFDLVSREKVQSYVASEFISTDGPFESSQNFSRFNIMGKLTAQPASNEKISVMLSHFTSEWDASGQIPQRAVDSGLISRFGAIDDTEGGNTSRTNASLTFDKFINKRSFLRSQLFFSAYDFELYSNFTFFLEDSLNGDQIRQKEDRQMVGLRTTYNQRFEGLLQGSLEVGIQLRSDRSDDNELSHTLNRTEVLEYIRLGDIREQNVSAWVSPNFDFGKWRINPAVRLDYFDFNYNNQLTEIYYPLGQTDYIVSPKLNILYNHSHHLQLYAKGGQGFHSNDSRGVIEQEARQTLPAAYGADIGFIWKPASKLVLNAALWHLSLEQEFVYVGDAGIVEPSSATTRQGLDISLRQQALDWLFWNIDANYTLARSTAEPEGSDFIPLAPDLTVLAGLNVVRPNGVFGGASLRFIDDRPANEDNSIIAVGYTVIDANVGYNGKNYSISAQVQNLLDTEWNETQFATESRLSFENAPVEEIHFTPGTPFFAKLSVEYRF